MINRGGEREKRGEEGRNDVTRTRANKLSAILRKHNCIFISLAEYHRIRSAKVRWSGLRADLISRHRGIGCLRTNVPAWRTSECACAQLRASRAGHPPAIMHAFVTCENEKEIARSFAHARERKREICTETQLEYARTYVNT